MSRNTRNVTPASNDVYVFQRPVKSLGQYYPVGTILRGSDYNDPTKIRRGRMKVSEGKVVFFPKNWGGTVDTDPNILRAKRLQAKLGISNLAADIKTKLTTNAFGVKIEEEPKIEVVPRPSSSATRKKSSKKAVVTKKVTIEKEA